MKVKICGITNLDDALMCIDAGADALGFVFTKVSPRFVEFKIADKIISKLSPFTMKIGVFVNETCELVNRTAEQIGLNAVQLHGDETPEYIKGISTPVIKSFRIQKKFNFSILKSYTGCVYLLDSYSDASAGGTGKTFDWENIPDRIRKDIILAGGISSANVETIYKKIKPGAVDLSSSLESSPGIKNKDKVIDFFNVLNRIRNIKC